MGNKIGRATDELFKEYECNTGQKLLRGIKSNSKVQIEIAIEEARKDWMSSSIKTTAEQDFEDMTKKVLRYLTRNYDVGGGMFSKKTPVQYAKECEARDALAYLESTIASLENHRTPEERKTEINAPVTTQLVGKIDSSRARTAKERLQAFQATRK